jgi:hypothetical protein
VLTALQLRQAFDDTLAHVRDAFGRIRANAGIGQVLTFPDLHKLTEGLFLSAWTYWEGLCRDLLVTDLANDAGGKLRSEVKKFRTKNAPFRLAERMLNHPDHPEKFVDWADYKTVRDRADEFLAPGHRFVALPRNDDVTKLKRIRNAVAHRSDKAWASFRSLVTAAPFNLAGNQLKGITPGRFLSSHQWNGVWVIEEAVNVLEASALVLVP